MGYAPEFAFLAIFLPPAHTVFNNFEAKVMVCNHIRWFEFQKGIARLLSDPMASYPKKQQIILLYAFFVLFLPGGAPSLQAASHRKY